MFNFSENLICACLFLFLKFFMEEFLSERFQDLPPKVKYTIFIAIVLVVFLKFSSA